MDHAEDFGRQKSAQEAFAEFSPQVYECSVSADVDQFDSTFLLLLRRFLAFDTAWIGKSTLVDNGFVLNSSCLYGLTHDYVDAWLRIRKIDAITPQVLAAPGKAVALSTFASGVNPTFCNFLKAFDIAETICVFFADRHQNTCMHISLYRTTGGVSFSALDAKLLEQAMQSFVFGSAICTLRRRSTVEQSRRDEPTEDTPSSCARETVYVEAGPETDSGSSTPSPLCSLTPRELTISRLFAQGLTYKAIAKQLSVSPCTVRHHLRSIYTKLEVNNKAQIAWIFNSAQP
ncbi:helix-turn-helix transcriptional regulator [Burkholderia sp. LMG 13014]|uniref:helix-turn-helix domain-containing protein n=1 Tax=Burkholderia sp. LMG 13014 TaxID=2709306 RepID=UPI001F057D6D|nr:helix-turn-helix transcriptional regulator [Burkholderia sp. LMG 13014]